MRSIRIIVGVSVFCLLFSLTALAQTTTSTIEGTVTDANGAVIAGAEVKASGITLATERSATTDAEGFYRLTALPAGTYTLEVSRSGFDTNTSKIELTLNRVATFDIQLKVGNVGGAVVNVTTELPLLEPNVASTGTTITPQQIQDLPVNGRDYLDLLQLVPGVAINRQADPDSDNANPVLGERSGNNNFFIDGHPNKDTVNGGPAAQFNQETIAEFQVLTTGYKAEFGQASGAIVNVITKSGGNEFHGVGSLFYRDDAFDSSNSLETTQEDALPLRRFDYSLAGGGPIIKDKFFFFASAERITERRQLDFAFPDTGNALVNQLLRDQEEPFDVPSRTAETRAFLKFNQQLGRHQLSQEVNYTNGRVKNFLPLSASSSLPSARNDSGARRLLLAFGDTVLLGDKGNPFILTLRGAYRGEKSDTLPSQSTLGGATLFVPFDAATCTFATCLIAGNLPFVSFGNARTPSNLDQKYTSFNASASKRFGDHDPKFGLNFLRTVVDGVDTRNLDDQLFATTTDFATFGAGTAGPILRRDLGGLTPRGDELHLRNNYVALYVQDDWKIRNNLTLNLGLRWDYDSEFEAKRNFAPRLGVAWAINPKTVLRANFGVYYDQFRLNLARDVPEFGGTDQRFVQYLLFPRGAYGSPSFITSLPVLSGFRGACFSNGLLGNLTDAQIAATPGLTCPLAPSLPLVGVDRFNNIVAPGHLPIPANTVITVNNVQALTGLTPEQYAAQASASIGQPGLLFFTPSGFLGHPILPPQVLPTTIDGTFKTPHTLGFNIGVQREIARDMVVEVDYFHRDIRNLLGVRNSNLAFESRVLGSRFLPPNTTTPIQTFGPFFEGQYDALIVNFNKRFSRRFLLGANYTYAKATDNSLGIGSEPSDAFIGIVPEVTEPSTGTSNANGSFTTTAGRFVAQAGTFLNGPDLDKGPSDLALDHIFQINGLIDLPWQIQVSGIFRAQSGFHFSRSVAFIDPDGNGRTNGIDTSAGRNAFTAPPFVNLDMRFAKQFDIGERVKVQVLFEFFNLLNRSNPAAVGQREGVPLQPFGKTIQVLPGREGQLGFRIEF
ncbi:MAG TPA: TonB-dependent receptor [Pyrinomonadaceae bacterium]|nr:TonB-dependent receptor [Pyrinomonadaceae bacterium]